MTVTKNPEHDRRLGGLRRFAVAITILNLLGHLFFGFEQSWAQPLVALATAYSIELLLGAINAWSSGQRPRFLDGARSCIDFLLPAHITGLAVGMLLYANERLLPIAFATAVAICSKVLFRAPVGRGVRHFFNPSNFGITITLLLFSWVGIAPPYHFTENLDRVGDWLLPAVIILSGSFLNVRFTQRIPLIAAWLGGFVAQAAIRSLILGVAFVPALLPMTGMGFILYTFYMVTDPATTPNSKVTQIAFGFAVALTYGLLLSLHVVFGLFFALTIVCAVRGLGLYVQAWMIERVGAKSRAVQTPAVIKEA